jgi:hypothetical protein
MFAGNKDDRASYNMKKTLYQIKN